MKAKQAIPIGITAAVLIAGLMGCIAVMSRDKGSTAQIYREDKLLYTIDLDSVKEPYSITIAGDHGEENIIRVEHGSISMGSASCPDKLCVSQGESHTGLPIVCLPNKVRIVVTDEQEADAYAG